MKKVEGLARKDDRVLLASVLFCICGMFYQFGVCEGETMKFDIYKLKDKYKLSDTEQKILAYILDHHEDVLSMGVRQVAAVNFASPAMVIKLAKKMGFTGFVDMVYQLNFLIKNRSKNRNHTSSLTSFIGNIDSSKLNGYMEMLERHKDDVILITATGFCSPIAEYITRKLLVRGFRCIQTNAYGVYDKNALKAGMVIAVSRSGETDTITKVVDYGAEEGVDILSFTGAENSHIARISTINIPILDDQSLDDRNLEANYFYARVIIVFEYLMDQIFCEN